MKRLFLVLIIMGMLVAGCDSNGCFWQLKRDPPSAIIKGTTQQVKVSHQVIVNSLNLGFSLKR